MLTIRRKRMLKLLLALVPVLAGVGLFVGMGVDDSWEQQNMLSPTAMLSMKIIMVCLALLVPVVVLFYRCDRRPHGGLRNLHRDEGGTAMVEMLFALPFMMMILLVLLQAVLMWQGSLTVHYAGYAATRAAVTVINGNYEDERRHLMFNDEHPLTPPSLKMVRIHRAAVIALLPVSGRLPSGRSYNDPDMSGDEFAALVVHSLENAPNADASMARRPWVARLAGQYAYADYFRGIAIRPPHHWNFDEPERGNRCPMRATRRTDWTQWGYNHENYCPHCPHTFDYPHNEPIELTLGFPVPLEVPWANRILYMMSLYLMSRDNRDSIVERTQLPGSGDTLYFTAVVVKTEL